MHDVAKKAGALRGQITFRLRWNSGAVKLYVRDCYRMIGDLTSRALVGAFADVQRLNDWLS